MLFRGMGALGLTGYAHRAHGALLQDQTHRAPVRSYKIKRIAPMGRSYKIERITCASEPHGARLQDQPRCAHRVLRCNAVAAHAVAARPR